VDAAKSIGCGLCCKVFDGDPADDGEAFSAPLREIRKTCRARDVPLIGWAYLYGDTYGNLMKEAQAVVRTLESGLPLVLDIEGQWEVSAGRAWAQTLAAYVLERYPDAKRVLAYTPFWNTAYHPRYPAAELSALCSAVMPQVYFDLGRKDTYDKQRDMMETAYKEYAPYGLPVYPIGEFGKRGIGDVAAFLSLVRGPHSWWLLDGWQDKDEMRYLAAVAGQSRDVARLAKIKAILKEV